MCGVEVTYDGAPSTNKVPGSTVRNQLLVERSDPRLNHVVILQYLKLS